MQLHEWYEIFLKAYGIDKPEDNEGAYLLELMIDTARDPKYASNRKYANIKVLTLTEWAKFWKSEEELTDFVFDQKTGYVMVNFRYNALISHELFVGAMYQAIENIVDDDMEKGRTAELYIDKYGFFKSSASYNFRNLTIGKNLVLSAEAKLAFKEWTFRREDMS